MPIGWKQYKTHKGKAGGVDCVAIHLPIKHFMYKKSYDRNLSKSTSLWPTDGTPQGLQRFEYLQTQPDEAGDSDARSRSSWATGPSWTASPTSPLIRKPRRQWQGFLSPLYSSPIRLKQTLDKSLRWGRWLTGGSAMVCLRGESPTHHIKQMTNTVRKTNWRWNPNWKTRLAATLFIIIIWTNVVLIWNTLI